jgi:hypothetical protein
LNSAAAFSIATASSGVFFIMGAGL